MSTILTSDIETIPRCPGGNCAKCPGGFDGRNVIGKIVLCLCPHHNKEKKEVPTQ